MWHLVCHMLDTGSSKSGARKELAGIINEYSYTAGAQHLNISQPQSVITDLPQCSGIRTEELDADISGA
ncbi:hypothetical protein HPB50_007898 [Hyalomma asiaticum]|uniref:Uncharacterized protein n=1 Tax=Hyalomma asiaticum TaxID=266040 RepID=A0ACB7RVA3_HYAAI|nr:hypothetical protein HPB50_007898 [Hyalomma asiaticum]